MESATLLLVAISFVVAVQSQNYIDGEKGALGREFMHFGKRAPETTDRLADVVNLKRGTNKFARDFLNFGKRSSDGSSWDDDERYGTGMPQKKDDSFNRDFMNFGKRAEPFERNFMNFGKKRADYDAFSRDFLSFGKR